MFPRALIQLQTRNAVNKRHEVSSHNELQEVT